MLIIEIRINTQSVYREISLWCLLIHIYLVGRIVCIKTMFKMRNPSDYSTHWDWEEIAAILQATQITKFMGPTWGPPGSCRPQMGPILDPWTLLSGDLFSRISLIEDLCVLTEFSLIFFPGGPLDNLSVLVRLIAWRRACDEPWPESMMTRYSDAYMRQQASLIWFPRGLINDCYACH